MFKYKPNAGRANTQAGDRQVDRQAGRQAGSVGAQDLSYNLAYMTYSYEVE
jgi:hypothetical protein